MVSKTLAILSEYGGYVSNDRIDSAEEMYPWNSMYGSSNQFAYLTEFQHQHRFVDDAPKRSSDVRVQFLHFYFLTKKSRRTVQFE